MFAVDAIFDRDGFLSGSYSVTKDRLALSWLSASVKWMRASFLPCPPSSTLFR